MNAVEIEEAVSELAGRPFDPAEFPYAFLTAFGNKDTTIKRLRSGQSNASDIKNGVLQRNNIHIAVCDDGLVTRTLVELRESPRTVSAKAKFVLATDGVTLETEDLNSRETIACVYQDFAQYFGFFLPLAGISTVKEIKNNPFDVKATGRLNKLYVELLKDNPDWATEEKRPALNQFIARLIFCFFAEDTSIFQPKQFTRIIDQMSDGQSGNTHEVLAELFRAMDAKPQERAANNIKNWANVFPYVNGGMFTGATDCPRFSRIARSYLLAIGNLEWDKINPDIFGSMIQAVADDDERGALGMHYTSVPNILKVLNPLFLDDLRDQLASADDNIRKLRNLRKRLANIRVFDPACGSGNFLVIAYKEMRAIEHEIVIKTKDEPKSWIKLDNFYGIEIKNFAVEIARLALLIAEFQSDVHFLNQQEARAMVLPLHRTGQIRVGNALTLDWLEVCPPVTKAVIAEHDLGGPTGRLALEENGLGESAEPETYICGNPPYKGGTEQTPEQKSDLGSVFSARTTNWKSLDYVSGWFMKFADYADRVQASCAFVSTNSISQGEQVARLWPLLFSGGLAISFAHSAFKWTNLAAYNAGVTVVVIGLSKNRTRSALLFENSGESSPNKREVKNINAYLVPHGNVIVEAATNAIAPINQMTNGNKPVDGGHLILDFQEARALRVAEPDTDIFIRPFVGAADSIQGLLRYCVWIPEHRLAEAKQSPSIRVRMKLIAAERAESTKPLTRAGANTPHAFQQVRQRGDEVSIVVPRHSSESRPYLPIGLYNRGAIIADGAFAIFDAPMWNFALLSSRIHLVWVAAVCGRIKTDYRYSSTLGWNTFPLSSLTEHNKRDLTVSAENILLARERQFPATVADLYEPEAMPDDLRHAHEINDDIVERIYIGRRFRNDTERLEKLFELYTRMTTNQPQPKKKAKRAA
jgi:hypothetical protein